MNINVLNKFEKEILPNFGEKTAIIDGDNNIKFNQLSIYAKSVASAIIFKKNETNLPIAVFLPKSAENIIANLGIIYSGCIYCNLDIKNPSSRISNIIKNIEPTLIITSKSLINSESLSDFNAERILIIEDILENNNILSDATISKRREKLIDTDPLCIINTSGSTGVPKGVVLNHKSFIDFTDWSIETLNISYEEKIGSLSPFYFDIYSFELCLCLSMASTIVIIPDQLAAFPIKIIEFLIAMNINFIFWVPTVMVNIANLDILTRVTPVELKKIIFAGEVFPTKHLNYWRRHLNEAIFVNLYGPIEITLDCTYYIVNRDFNDDEPIPIGQPCKNTDVLILNNNNELVDVNEQGELCVRGTSLAMGYYNDPEKTRKAFVQNPLNDKYPEIIYRTGDLVYINENDEIMFVGRKDFQIKHLGYRLELSEIEHVIVNSFDKILNACVLYDTKNKAITLFYESESEFDNGMLRKEFGLNLPKYMLPTKFMWFSELPRNPNGKIDRNKLETDFLNF